MIIFDNIDGLLRAINSIIIFSSFSVGIISHSFDIGFLGIVGIVSEILTNFEKTVIFKNLHDNNLLPGFLGRITRPDGAKNCSLFITEKNFNKLSTSLGMPSGHTQLAFSSATYLILYLLENQPKTNKRLFSIAFVIFIAIVAGLSRIQFNCHTFQQVIVGGLFGILYGYLGFKTMKKIKLYNNKRINGSS